MKKKIKLLLQLIFIFLFIYLFYKFINTEELIRNLLQIEIKYLFISFLFILLIPIVTAIRWKLICKNYININFIDNYFNMIKGYGFNSITSTSVAIDVFKYMNIYKIIGKKNSFFLVLFDKFFSLYAKIFFLIIVINILNISIYNFQTFLIFMLSILVMIIMFMIFIYSPKILNIKFLNIFFTENNLIFLKDFLINFRKEYLKFVFLIFFSQFIVIFAYFFLFLAVIKKNILIYLTFLIPALETITQVQIIIGMREFITSVVFTFFDVPIESSLVVASIFTFLCFVAIMFQNAIVLILRKK